MGPKHRAPNCNQQAAASHHLAAQQCQAERSTPGCGGSPAPGRMLTLSFCISSPPVTLGQVARSPFPSHHSMKPPAQSGPCVHIIHLQPTSLLPQGEADYSSLHRGSKHKSIGHHTRFFYKLGSSQVCILSAINYCWYSHDSHHTEWGAQQSVTIAPDFLEHTMRWG